MRLIYLSMLVLAASSVKISDGPSKIEELKDIKDTSTIPKNIALENPDTIKPTEEEKAKMIEEHKE